MKISSLSGVSLVISIILTTGLLRGQTITGEICDAATNETLAYVNIGVVGQPRGTVTDEDGAFALETAGLSADATVRFSMIGYVAQTFTMKELTDNNGKIVKLVNAPVQLSEVVVKSQKFGKPRKVGAAKVTNKYGVCGWGGTEFGQGHELGTRISLGSSPVYIQSLHIRIF